MEGHGFFLLFNPRQIFLLYKFFLHCFGSYFPFILLYEWFPKRNQWMATSFLFVFNFNSTPKFYYISSFQLSKKYFYKTFPLPTFFFESVKGCPWQSNKSNGWIVEGESVLIPFDDHLLGFLLSESKKGREGWRRIKSALSLPYFL